jgi:hypothetical protein
MTPAQTALCAMLFGGMIGSGSVVAVQKATSHKPSANVKKPPVSHTRKAQPVSKPYKLPSPAILDCPTTLGSPWGIEQYQPAGFLPPQPGTLPPSVEQPGGGGFVLLPPSYSPAIPEPGTWAMMIAGFGLVGMALRRKEIEA